MTRCIEINVLFLCPHGSICCGCLLEGPQSGTFNNNLQCMVSWGSAYEYPQCIFLHDELQDFMAKFDACPTGNQEVEGLIPAGS